MVQHKLWVHRTPSAQSKSAAVLIVAASAVCGESVCFRHTRLSPQKKKVQRTTGQTISKKDATVTFHCQKAPKKTAFDENSEKEPHCCEAFPFGALQHIARRHPAAPGRSRQHRRTPGFLAAAGRAQRACCASCQRRPFSVFAIAGNSQNLSSAKKKKRERATRARTHEGLKLPLWWLFFSFLRLFPPPHPPVFLTPPASAHPVPCTPASRHIPESDLNRACGQRVCVWCVR